MANKSTCRHQLGAVLVKGNRIISVGFNKDKTSVRRSNHPFAAIHSETDCLASALPFEIENATMYIYRELKNGLVANAMPCRWCREALKKAKVKRICYTIENGYKEEEL